MWTYLFVTDHASFSVGFEFGDAFDVFVSSVGDAEVLSKEK